MICANQRVLFTHSYCYTCLHLFSAYEHFLCCIPDDDAEKALVKSEARRGGALAGQSHKTSHHSTFKSLQFGLSSYTTRSVELCVVVSQSSCGWLSLIALNPKASLLGPEQCTGECQTAKWIPQPGSHFTLSRRSFCCLGSKG